VGEPGVSTAVRGGDAAPAPGPFDEPDPAPTIPITAAAAAAPITASSTVRLLPPSACATAALVCRRLVEARRPFSEAVTRISNGPAMRFGRKPRPTARPSPSVVTESIGEPLPNIPPGPAAGAENVTAAFATGRFSASLTNTTGSLARPAVTLLIAPSPSVTTIFSDSSGCARDGQATAAAKTASRMHVLTGPNCSFPVPFVESLLPAAARKPTLAHRRTCGIFQFSVVECELSA